MPGEAHTAALRLLGVSAAALVLVLPAFAEPSPLGRASALQLENAHLETRSRAAVLDLYSLDARLATAQARLATLRTRLGALRHQRAVLADELRVARNGERSSERQLAIRLRQLYDQGDVSPLEIVFGASSISDAMTQLDNIDHVASLNNDVLAQLRSAQTRLVATSATLGERTRQLQAAVATAASVATSLAETRAARAGYVAQLQSRRSLNDTQIAQLEVQARAAESRSQQLTGSTPAAAVATPVVATAPAPAAAADAPAQFAGARTITVGITGYALPGTTATGIPVGWGVAAVDPHVIPLGTHLWVPGYGEAVAADVGSAIIGARVDLWFPSVAQAYAWGWRTVTISLH